MDFNDHKELELRSKERKKLNYMQIACHGTIGVVTTKQKRYIKKRKGYYIGEKWVKPKRTVKFKQVPIKEPYLSGQILLSVNAELMLNGTYMDDACRLYICTSITRINGVTSTLMNANLNLGIAFSIPTRLQLIGKRITES